MVSAQNGGAASVAMVRWLSRRLETMNEADTIERAESDRWARLSYQNGSGRRIAPPPS